MATKAGSGVESTQRAMLFADVCDSTAIYESLGDAQALALINRLFDRLGAMTAAHEGIVIKTLGDGVVCQFRDADEAFRAACDMQTAAASLSPRAQAKFAIKIGFNYGPVVVKGDDVFGDTVNVCSRLNALGQPRAGADHAADRRRAVAGPARALPAALPAQGQGQGRADHGVRRAVARSTPTSPSATCRRGRRPRATPSRC